MHLHVHVHVHVHIRVRLGGTLGLGLGSNLKDGAGWDDPITESIFGSKTGGKIHHSPSLAGGWDETGTTRWDETGTTNHVYKSNYCYSFHHKTTSTDIMVRPLHSTRSSRNKQTSKTVPGTHVRSGLQIECLFAFLNDFHHVYKNLVFLNCSSPFLYFPQAYIDWTL